MLLVYISTSCSFFGNLSLHLIHFIPLHSLCSQYLHLLSHDKSSIPLYFPLLIIGDGRYLRGLYLFLGHLLNSIMHIKLSTMSFTPSSHPLIFYYLLCTPLLFLVVICLSMLSIVSRTLSLLAFRSHY